MKKCLIFGECGSGKTFSIRKEFPTDSIITVSKGSKSSQMQWSDKSLIKAGYKTE